MFKSLKENNPTEASIRYRATLENSVNAELVLGVAPKSLRCTKSPFKPTCCDPKLVTLQVDCTANAETYFYRPSEAQFDLRTEGTVQSFEHENHYMHLDWTDYGNYSRTKDKALLKSFQAALEWEKSQVSKDNKPRIYVHCKSGRGRSGEWAVLYAAFKELQQLQENDFSLEPPKEADKQALAEYIFDQHGYSIKMARGVMDAANPRGADSKRQHGIVMVRKMLGQHWSQNNSEGNTESPPAQTLTTFECYQNYRRLVNQNWRNILNKRMCKEYGKTTAVALVGFTSCVLMYVLSNYLAFSAGATHPTNATNATVTSNSTKIVPPAIPETMHDTAVTGIIAMTVALCLAYTIQSIQTGPCSLSKNNKTLTQKTNRTLADIIAATEQKNSAEKWSSKKPKKQEKFIRQLLVDILVFQRDGEEYDPGETKHHETALKHRVDDLDQAINTRAHSVSENETNNSSKSTQLSTTVSCQSASTYGSTSQTADATALFNRVLDLARHAKIALPEETTGDIESGPVDNKITLYEPQPKLLSPCKWWLKWAFANCLGGSKDTVSLTHKEHAQLQKENIYDDTQKMSISSSKNSSILPIDSKSSFLNHSGLS